jgi:hypothetical protein
MKDRLIYVATDGAGSDNVGAVLKDSAGNHITSTDMGGGVRALDVNVVSGAADGLYAEDSASADGHMGVSVFSVRKDALAALTNADGDYADLLTNSDGALWTAPVGDIADDIADGGKPVKVGGKAYGTLSTVNDGDRSNLSMDLHRRVRVNDAPDVAVLQSQDNVDNVAEVLMGTALAGRKKLFVQNLSTSRDIYVGATGVTTANGFQIRRGVTWEFEAGPNIALYAIGVDATAADIRQLELA